MTFGTAIRTCFQKYITVEGRARRAEYWWFLLFAVLGNFVTSLVDQLVFGPEATILAPIFGLGILLPAVCVAVRRLHDRDMSGWWILLNLVPLVGSLILLAIYALPGSEGRNRFGPSPLEGRGDDDPGEGYSPSSIPRSGRE